MKIERFGNSEFGFKKYHAFIAIIVTLAESAIQNLKPQIESLHYSYTPLLQDPGLTNILLSGIFNGFQSRVSLFS